VSLGGAAPLTVGVNGLNQYREGYPLGGYWSPRVRSVDVARGVAVVSDTTEYGGSPFAAYQGALWSDLMLFRKVRVSGLIEFREGSTLWNATTWYREKVFGLEERFQRRASLPPAERLRLFGPYVNSRGQPVVNSTVIDDYLQDASFVRLRELSVSWRASTRVAERLRASSVTVAAGARNLALWTRYRGGWDPESITIVPTSGIFFAADYYTMPKPQRFFARLNVGF
jgi:hypothetical protein